MKDKNVKIKLMELEETIDILKIEHKILGNLIKSLKRIKSGKYVTREELGI